MPPMEVEGGQVGVQYVSRSEKWVEAIGAASCRRNWSAVAEIRR